MFITGRPEAIILKKTKDIIYLPILSIVISSCGGGSGGSQDLTSEPVVTTVVAFSTKADLGEALFFDENLSFNRTQSCSTCHNPDTGFIDDRTDDSGERLTGSIGDDGLSIGDRNAPSLSYIGEAPDFGFGSHQRFNSQQNDYEGYLGGYFSDGRAFDVQAQAREPMLSEAEMGMKTEPAVIERILENEDYVESIIEIYGESIFDNDRLAFSAVTESIAEFQESTFSSFDSKYDLSLIGEYTFNPISRAAAGRALFFSAQFTNCATCHQLNSNNDRNETFTSYEYHNIGVPINEALREKNGFEPEFIDIGLANNEQVTEDASLLRGMHKVPTLRNIAITGPYMHNGVFSDLRTVIKFYDQYLTNSEFTTNPETGEEWAAPEVEETINFEELQDGRTLSEADIDSIICFLHTLTDARYENLLDDSLDCGI